jgi:hypothetical protein
MVKPMLKWRRAILAVAGVGVLVSLLLNVGLCPSEFRVLRDRDYFKGAIDVVIRDPVDGVVEQAPGMVVLKQVRSQRYASAEEFLSEFPDCCRFVARDSGDGGPEISLLDALLGVRAVEVSYDKRYAAADGNSQSTKVTARIAVTSCGKGRSYR